MPEPHAWLVRGSKNGARDQWMLANGYTGVDFQEVPSLAGLTTRDEVRALVEVGLPGFKPKAVIQYTAQLYAFSHRMQIGDIVVLPMRNSGPVALGIVIGDYEHKPPGSDGLTHVRKVEWRRTDVSRTAIEQDLLFSLGSFSTVAEISRHDAAWRLGQLLEGAAIDPGPRGDKAGPTATPVEDDDLEDVSVEAGRDILQDSEDRVSQRLQTKFAGHRLAELVAALLEAEGLHCTVSPPGADGGVDILAGSGVLGIESPRIVVQVKSQPSAVGSEVVDQLAGVTASRQADQGLLVAMGGVTKPARAKLDAQPFKFAVWDAAEIMERLFRHYAVLPDLIRADIPLKLAWVIDERSTND